MKRAVLFLAGSAAVLTALLFALRPAQPRPSPEPIPMAALPASRIGPVTAQPKVESVALQVQNGQQRAGPETIRVVAGTSLRLTLTSDSDDELHVHGYDLHLELLAHRLATLTFTADHSGRFDYELHHAGIELGALEVMPP